MAVSDHVWFAEFRLDGAGELLWRGQERLPLSPKAFAILRYFIDHQGQLVTKTALFDAIWSDTVVGDGVLAVGIAELRRALGDDPQTPRFIETVHRRGYRFLPVVTTTQPVSGSQTPVVSSGQGEQQSSRLVTPFVGRDQELSVIHQLLDKSQRGERQMLFITGEAGSGKTALVATFLHRLAANGQPPGLETDGTAQRALRRDARVEMQNAAVWVGYGQCVEHYSAGEAYFPILEALTRLCRTPRGNDLLDVFRVHAPTWLLQMPAVLSPTERAHLRQQGYATTRDRMVRELVDAMAVFTATHAVVLVLEDLHWSDYATLDVLSTLARRPETARLLVLGTYRPADVGRGTHPLRTIQHELHMHQHCQVLALTGLTASDIAAHLMTRFPQHRFPPTLAPLLHQRTDGNPLFLVNMLEELQVQAAIVAEDGQWTLAVEVETITTRTPASTRALIEQHVERLSPAEQRVLEAASVVGVEWTVGAVAAALDLPLPEVEAQCEQLARQGQFLRAAEVRELPGGTLTAQYAFVHAVYQATISDRISAARRIRMHHAIARWLETIAGESAVEIAAELAVHYEQGRDAERALHYLEHAARKAMRRGAAYEAIRHLRTALRLLPTLAKTTGQSERELTLYTLLAPALMTAKGYGTTEVKQIYNRVLTLAHQIEDVSRIFPVLVSVGAFHTVRGAYRMAHESAIQLLQIAQRQQEPGLLVQAHALMGVVAFYLGEFVTARAQLEQSLALYDPNRHQAHALHYGQDPRVVCYSYLAWTLWTLGYPEQAQARSQEAIAYAHQLQHPMSLAFAIGLAAIVQNVCRDAQAGGDRATELIALATEHGLPYWEGQGRIAYGRALVQSGRANEGLAHIQQAVQARREIDGLGERPSFAILAEAYAATGEAEAGLEALAEAQTIAQSGGGRYWDAEIFRLQGELLLQRKSKKQKSKSKSQRIQTRAPHIQIPEPESEAEASFAQALRVAQQQHAKSLELRAAVSLARLWQQQEREREAHQLVAEVYSWFSEGFATQDLQEAKAVLDVLAARVSSP